LPSNWAPHRLGRSLALPFPTGAEKAARWSPKLTDFGMAKLLEQDGGDRTRSGAILGTLAYMAPEQVEGRIDQVDARADVYALGAILYELLTGAAPYRGQSDVDTLRQLIVNEPVAPRKLRADVPRDVEAIVLKCLARCPAARYATANELAADLRRFLEARPTVARPLGFAQRAVNWARRRPAIAALWLVSVVAVMVAIGINTRRIEDVSRANAVTSQFRTEATQQRQRAVDEMMTARHMLYASRMRKAQQAWRDGNLKLLRGILQDYADSTSEANLRHFEWYHLNYLANLPHRVFRGHTGEVYAVAYAPGGRVVVTGGEDGTVRLWDAASGEALAVLHEHASCINSIDFSPDGDTFATASCDKTIKLWSLSRRKVLATLEGHRDAVDGCLFIDRGKLLASLSRNTTGPREARIWDVAARSMRSDWLPSDEHIEGFAGTRSGRTLVTLSAHNAAVWKRRGDSWALSHRCNNVDPNVAAVLSPDEEYLVVPRGHGQLQVFRVRDGVLVNELNDHTGTVVGISFSPSGNRMATASSDGSIGVFEFPSGQVEHRLLGHEGTVWQVTWSARDDSIASVGVDGTLRVWDLQQGSSGLHLRLPEKRLPAVGDTPDFAFLQDGRHVSAAYKEDSIVWDVKTGRRLSAEHIEGPRLQVSGRRSLNLPLAEVSHALLPQWDRNACFIPARMIGEPSRLPINTVSCVRIVGDGSRVVEFRDGRLRIWSANPLALLAERTMDPFDVPPLMFDISRDGGRLCSVSNNGRFEILDLKRGTAVDLGKIAHVSHACLSPHGDRILVLGDGLCEYDAHSGARIREYSYVQANAMSYSAEGERIAVSSNLGFIAIHDAITGEETLRLDGGAYAMVFASDGASLLASGAPDGGLYLWPGKKATSP